MSQDLEADKSSTSDFTCFAPIIKKFKRNAEEKTTLQKDKKKKVVRKVKDYGTNSVVLSNRTNDVEMVTK